MLLIACPCVVKVVQAKWHRKRRIPPVCQKHQHGETAWWYFSEWQFIFNMKAKKKTVGALWHSDNLPLNGKKKKKKKLFTYIKCWREKKGKQKHQFVTIHICLHLNIKLYGLPLYQGHCASKLPSPHSWKHEIWKHSIWILLMVSNHKVKLIAAILRCNRWLQACFHL